jgi:hypothetical protein
MRESRISLALIRATKLNINAVMAGTRPGTTINH